RIASGGQQRGRRARRAATGSSGAEQVFPSLSVSVPSTNPTVHNSRSGERQVEVRAAAISATSGRDDGDSLDSDGDSLDNDGDRAAVGSPSIPANLE
ncbi:hypothetical protein Dimus_016679, partial [Dionaea muscipula]